MVKKVEKTTSKIKSQSRRALPGVQAPMHNSVLISWAAPGYKEHSKGVVWYAVATLSLLGILWYSLMSGSWSTAVVFLLFAGVYVMSMQHKSPDVMSGITELGVQHGTKFYPFSRIKGYWVVYKPPEVKVLHIQLVGKKEDISIELGNQSPVQVRNLLSREIPEIEGKGEPFLNYVTRILKL